MPSERSLQGAVIQVGGDIRLFAFPGHAPAELIEEIQQERQVRYRLPLRGPVRGQNNRKALAVRCYVIGLIYTQVPQAPVGPYPRLDGCEGIAASLVARHHDLA